MSSGRPKFLFLPLAILSIPHIVFAVLVNRTIDDTYGDSVTGEQVQYLPEHSPDDSTDPYWKNAAECAASGCAIKPPTSLAFNNTYTSTTYFPNTVGNNISAGFTFNGSAIYIYLILSNEPENSSLVSNVSCDFRLDGQVVGNFSHTSDESGQFQFNVLAYSASGLVLGNHTMLLETSGSQSSLDMFDYAVYTTDVEETPSPPPSSSPSSSSPSPDSKKLNLGALLGGLFGGMAVITIVTVLAVLLRRRRREAQRELRLASQISELDIQQISGLGRDEIRLTGHGISPSRARYKVRRSTQEGASTTVVPLPRKETQSVSPTVRSDSGSRYVSADSSSAVDSSPEAEDLPPAYSSQ